MRLLLIPHVGINSPTDSNFAAFLGLARTLSDAGDWTYLTGPWRTLDVPLPPRCVYLPLHEELDYYSNFFAADLEWLARGFSRRWGRWLIDAVVTSKIAAIPYLIAALSDTLRCDDMPVYGYEPQVPRKAIPVSTLGHLRALGYATGIAIFQTEWAYEHALTQGRLYLSSRLVDRLADQSIIMPPGLDFDELDALRARVERPDPRRRFTLFSGQRLNASKRMREVVALLDTLWQAGLPSELVVVSPTSEEIGGAFITPLRGREDVRLTFGCPREDYLEAAAAAHAAVCMSTNEAAPLGYIEQLYLGAVVLFAEAEWARRFLPPDYPWFFKGAGQAAAMAAAVARDYPSCADRIERWRPWLRETFARAGTWPRVREDLARRLVEGRHARITNGVREMLGTALTVLPPVFSFEDLLRVIGKTSRGFQPRVQQRRWWTEPTNYELHRGLLDELQYTDLCDGAWPRYAKAA